MTDFRLHRRDVLTGVAAMAPLLPFGRAYAAHQAGSRLLIIFLRGAYDALNIVAPTGNDFYHQSRPNIGLGKADAKNPAAPLSLDGDWSLHPALRDSMLPLWQKKQLAFIPFAGTNDLSRSHFQTQDTIELGQPIGTHRNYSSGFMGRLAEILGQKDKPIAFTDQLPLCFRGSSAPIPNLAIARLGKPMASRQSELIQSMYQGHNRLGQSVKEGFQIRDTAFRTVDEEMKAAGRGATTTKGFELSARRIGAMMRDQFNLAFVDMGGWDTHVNQGARDGALANRIGDLGRGIAGFVDAIGPEAWRSTTVVVMSEFGRTFHENGAKGTDHGHGSIYWVLGGGVSGGRLAGEQIQLTPDTLNEGRDLPVLTDYRGLVGGLVARQFGLKRDQLVKLFPDSASTDLRLL
ncbi:DUF1501 domain-containing protein [Sphingobium sp. LF-16]|uniref:DUF1501 domain-containing protein n=1 Tax=Sphingobium sp. LF-16 TaxID=2185111 RepID=UPI000F099BB6|nr:DUF1501 domain-containing protein [Sphingobium sp. LF-16]